MKNAAQWRPSRFVYRDGRLRSSRDRSEVGIASTLINDAVAAQYERALPLHAHGRLLDLGCGKVPLYGVYQQYVTDNVCVDWENTLHPNEYLDLHANLSEPLPFHDGEFDTILLSDVLEHLPEPERLWSEMARILVPGGKLILNVPFYYWIHEEPHDYYRYTEYALKRFAARSGLDLVEITAIGGAPEIMADVFSKVVVHLGRVGPHLAVFTQWAASRFVRTRWGARISAVTRGTFPLGYFLIASKPAAQ